MGRKKIYTAPEAEFLLLAPCEALAVTESEFTYKWFGEPFKTEYFKDLVSGGGIVNGGKDPLGSNWEEDGFTILD